MSGTSPGGPHAAAGGADPSMEDILASIRRILSEDEAAAAPVTVTEAAPPPPEEPDDPDVLTLDASMLAEEPAQPALPPEVAVPVPPAPEPIQVKPEPVTPVPVVAAPEPAGGVEPAAEGLVAPAVVAAAASSVGTLVRTLAGHQAMSVYRGGPTLEDIVREEIRPMLKSWLDENLPPLVERLVRAEIERVVGRAAS